MKTFILFSISLLVVACIASATLASPISTCTHILDLSNGQCYKLNQTTAVDNNNNEFKIKYCLITSYSSSSFLSSSFSFSFSSINECGISVSKEFSNSLHLTQSGLYSLISFENKNKNTQQQQQSKYLNLIFGSLDSVSLIEFTIDSPTSSLTNISHQFPTIEMLTGKIVIKTKR